LVLRVLLVDVGWLLIIIHRLLVLRLLDWDWNHHFLGFRHNTSSDKCWHVSRTETGWGRNVTQIARWRWGDVGNVYCLNLLDGFIGLSNINSVLLKYFLFLLLIFDELLLFLLKKFNLFNLSP
jgi:hypothetical protein